MERKHKPQGYRHYEVSFMWRGSEFLTVQPSLLFQPPSAAFSSRYNLFPEWHERWTTVMPEFSLLLCNDKAQQIPHLKKADLLLWNYLLGFKGSTFQSKGSQNICIRWISELFLLFPHPTRRESDFKKNRTRPSASYSTLLANRLHGGIERTCQSI